MRFLGEWFVGGLVFLWVAGAGAVDVSAAGDGPALPAFPGAEGFGAVSVGGRGGKVIKVTNLKSDGPGSLQWALDQEGPRVIVFDVSGVIVPPNVSKGRRYLAIRHSNVTIAGQTAPGAGITINGMFSTRRGRKEKTLHDVTVRFLRVRPTAAKGSGRNLRALELSNSDRIIIDHVSGSWSKDDCFDLYTAKNATVQWCSVEESDIWLEGGDEPHNFGMITGYGGPRPINVHHTLLAHHRERTPLTGSFPFDFRNNVLYNCGGMIHLVRSSYAEQHSTNIVGNYAKAGPAGMIGVRIYRPPHTIARGSVGPYRKGRGRFYLAGNYTAWRGGYVEPWRAAKMKNVVAEPLPGYPPVTTHTAERAFDMIVAAGGCLPRDAVSKRTVREMLLGGGAWGCHVPDAGLMEGLTPGEPPPDTDKDGMPDAWETAHDLDPKDPADATGTVPKGASKADRHAGYTWIEYYVNEAADTLVAAALTRARLHARIPKDGGFRAGGLSPMAEHHDSLAGILAAIKDQNMARQNAKDRRTKYDTDAAWLAVQQLSRMGAEAKPAVPELVRLLEGDDRRTATFAAWGLGAIGPDAADAVPALIRALGRDWGAKHSKWTWCPVGFAAWALGRIGSDADATVPALAKVLAGRGHPWATRQALWALRRMGPKARSAMDVLLRHVGSPHAPAALAAIGEPAVPALRKTLADSRPWNVIGALKALGGMGPTAKAAAPDVTPLLGHANPGIRAWAVWTLARIAADAGRVVPALMKALADTEMNVRHKACEGLAAWGDAAKPAVRALQERLESDPQGEVQAAAARALAVVRPEGPDALATALAKHKSAFVRACAARALAGEGATAPALVRTLSDRDATVRREAVWALGRAARSNEVAAALRKALDDPDYVVRTAAAEILKPKARTAKEK
jgi:HEAT repeat protein